MTTKKNTIKTDIKTQWDFSQLYKSIHDPKIEKDIDAICKHFLAFAKKHKDAIYFLAGREKNAPGTDFSDKEVSAAKIIAQALENANSAKLDELVANEILKEICHEK